MSRTYEVELRFPPDHERSGESETITVAEDEYVLTVARASGIWLPADCRKGWCTTCAAKLVEGDLDQSDARRYFDVDREEGFVLPCTARPRSDLVLEVGAYDEMLDHRAAADLPPGNAKR